MLSFYRRTRRPDPEREQAARGSSVSTYAAKFVLEKARQSPDTTVFDTSGGKLPRGVEMSEWLGFLGAITVKKIGHASPELAGQIGLDLPRSFAASTREIFTEPGVSIHIPRRALTLAFERIPEEQAAA